MDEKNDTSGRYVMNRPLSTPHDDVLAAQGVSWLHRTAISFATVHLSLSNILTIRSLLSSGIRSTKTIPSPKRSFSNTPLQAEYKAPQANTTSPAKTTSTTTMSLALFSSPRNGNRYPKSQTPSSKRAGHPEPSRTRASSGRIPFQTSRSARTSGLQSRFGGMPFMISLEGGGRKDILGRYTLSRLL